MYENQGLRNRAIVEEIVETIDKYTGAVEKKYSNWRNVEID